MLEVEFELREETQNVHHKGTECSAAGGDVVARLEGAIFGNEGLRRFAVPPMAPVLL